MAGRGGNNKLFQYCTDPSWQEILYVRALQGHSGRNPIVPSLQDNVLIPNNVFEYIYHIGCAVNLRSNTKFRIDSGRTKFEQGLTDGILHSHESHAQESPRSKRAWSDQTTSCILQEKVESASRHGVLGRHTACSVQRIEVLSNKVERSHPFRYTPSLLYPEGDCDEIWRSLIPESVCVTSTTADNFPQRWLDVRFGFWYG